MPFNEDLQSFIDFLKTNDDFNQTKKEYRRLIKLYHPDHAAENEKDLCNEYNKGHEILHWHNINYLDKEAINQNSLEVMQHYWNAIKCYKFLLKNCTDPIILSTCEFDLKMTQDSVNVLARTITNSDDKGLMEV